MRDIHPKRDFLNSVTAMFPIDRSLLPSLATRRALVVVDPQNDFLAEDGALPIIIPRNLPERIADLVTAFRKNGGDIIWVCSRFEKSRSVVDEQILTSDRPSHTKTTDSRGRRRQASPQTNENRCECPEAFLTQESLKLPKCVRPGSSGIDIHPTIKEAVGPRDYSIVKSFYSAFKSEQLLRLLRMRLVTELFICGSTTNTSIMATAVDAASHAYDITIVDDCCGGYHIMRQRAAIKQISNTTGCDVITAEEVLASFKPKPKPSRRPSDRPATSPGSRHSSVRRTRPEDDSTSSSASDLLSSFKNLSLSPGRAADTLDVKTPTQNPTLPIQPLVSSPKAEDAQEPPTSQSASTSDDVKGVKGQQPKSESDESQNTRPDSRIDAQPPNKESSPPVTQNDRGIVPEHDLKVSQLDKESKTSIPSTARLKSDQVSSETKTDNSIIASNSKLKLETLTHKLTSENHPESTDTPSKNTIENVKMANEDIPKLKQSEPLGEGDTAVIYDILPKPLSDDIFEKVKNEAKWQRMMHQGGEVPRLAAIQGEVGQDGSMPVYRHPMDESPPLSPFSPTVLEIKKEVEKQLGHSLNHVLIQFYRDGNDFISEHSDKTIDVVKDTYIANVSLGAERTMLFRSKRQQRNKNAETSSEPSPASLKRRTQRIALPHNSLCKMGLKTNMKWLHSVRADKRPDCEKSDEQLAYDGGRISLTFRQIGTFLDRESKLIWGQGATAKTKEEASQVVNGDPALSKGMVQRFSQENNASDFDWNDAYGGGFDVLHINSASRLFLSSDRIINMRIQLQLAEYGIDYARGSMSPLFSINKDIEKRDVKAVPEDAAIKFADNDYPKTIVNGETAIMLYLDRVYGKKTQDNTSRRDLAKELTRFQQGLTLLAKYRAIGDVTLFEPHLRVWEEYAAEGQDFIAGPTITLADYAFWPVLNDVVRTPGRGDLSGFENLKRYYERIKSREAGRKVIHMDKDSFRKKADASIPGVMSSAGSSAAETEGKCEGECST